MTLGIKPVFSKNSSAIEKVLSWFIHRVWNYLGNYFCMHCNNTVWYVLGSIVYVTFIKNLGDEVQNDMSLLFHHRTLNYPQLTRYLYWSSIVIKRKALMTIVKRKRTCIFLVWKWFHQKMKSTHLKSLYNTKKLKKEMLRTEDEE